MSKHSTKSRKREHQIQAIEITSERLTGRAGLALFVSYMHSTGIFNWFDQWFGTIRKSRKAISICELFKQALCFMFDGTSRRLTYFDELRQDDGYAAVIETEKGQMASSHQMKRFFKAFSFARVFMFRWLLQKMFIWRLKNKQPDIIELGIDTMVMDNDDAKCREGVRPTYKKKKGFQPLQMNWGRFIVDAVFRSGHKHSNHGQAVQNMIRHMVNKIRRDYRDDVPIILRIDSGFFDQKIFKVCEDLGIGYLCGGKMYNDIKETIAQYSEDEWNQYESGKKDIWEFIEFGNKRESWNIFRRTIYCRLIHDERGQYYLPGFKPDNIIITNIGKNEAIDERLKESGFEDYLEADTLVACYHERGTDELANRALKNFGHEQLPFKKFNPNAAWYYMMLIGHFLMESFKEDVSESILPVGSYASTIRRRLIDIAGKVVSHSGKIVLKVSEVCHTSLQLPALLERCNKIPMIR